MAATKPAPLCTHLMPSGKLCRGVALRNQRYCRSHIRNSRILERDRAQYDALEQLSLQIQPMDLSALLVFIQGRLVQLSRSCTIARFPEICYLLTYAIDRLDDIKYAESNISPELTPDQIPEDLSNLSLNELNQMIAGLSKSIT